MEEARTGWIAVYIYDVFTEEWAGFWRDACVIGWYLSTVSFIMSVLAAVVQLMAINELEENYMQAWVNAVGSFSKKVPFRYMFFGILFTFLLPFTIRTQCTWQTLLGPIGSQVVTVYVVFFLYAIYKYLYAIFLAIDESERHSPISISKEEMAELAAQYFKENPETYNLDGFLATLHETMESGWTVPLTYPTSVRAKKSFFEQVGLVEGIEIKDSETLMRLCL
jgi:hypothetical protein